MVISLLRKHCILQTNKRTVHISQDDFFNTPGNYKMISVKSNHVVYHGFCSFSASLAFDMTLDQGKTGIFIGFMQDEFRNFLS